MKVLTYIVIAINLFLNDAVDAQAIEIKEEGIQKNMESCIKLAKDPYFEPEFVVGKPWRVYHTWNVKFGTKCVDLVFRNATPAIIRRIHSDMSDYMEQQPFWESAVLLLTSGSTRQELLLFPAQGVAGGFTAVPNVIRSGDITPARNGVPLLKFQLKLIRHGKFLVIMDCHIGVTSLAARTTHKAYRSDIAAAVDELNLGDGFPACTQEKNKDEQFFTK